MCDRSPVGSRDADVYEANRLIVCGAPRPGNTGYRDGRAYACTRKNTSAHFTGDFPAYGAKLDQALVTYVDFFMFCFIRVGDKSSIEDF